MAYSYPRTDKFREELIMEIKRFIHISINLQQITLFTEYHVREIVCILSNGDSKVPSFLYGAPKTV